jgi:hypothetical protein
MAGTLADSGGAVENYLAQRKLYPAFQKKRETAKEAGPSGDNVM